MGNLDPAGDLEEWQKKAQREEERNIAYNADGKTLFTGSVDDGPEAQSDISNNSNEDNKVSIANVEDVEQAHKFKEDAENRKLVRMGMQTAVAIALHNFPE